MVAPFAVATRHRVSHTCLAESGYRRRRLVQRLVWALTAAVTLSACGLCMTTQCRGRPFLSSQEVRLLDEFLIVQTDGRFGKQLAQPPIYSLGIEPGS